MSEPKNPKTSSTDEMIAALAEEFGLGSKPGSGADGGKEPSSKDPAKPGNEEAPAGKDEPSPKDRATSPEPEKEPLAKSVKIEKDGKKDEKRDDKKGKDKGKIKLGKESKESRDSSPAAADTGIPGKTAPLAPNPDDGLDHALFPTAGTKHKEMDLSDLGDPAYSGREEEVVRSEKRLLLGLLVTLLVVAVAGAVILSYFMDQRRNELKAHDIEPESSLEMLTQFDVHQQEMLEFRKRKAEIERKSRTPLYGHLRIETDPNQADVYIACIPMDARCNNIGTKEAPRWDDHFVKDDELGDKACSNDAECQDCQATAPAAPPAPPAPAAPGAAPAPVEPPKPVCRFPDAKCASGVCRMPMRTAITIQSLWIGNQLALDKDRKYQVRISKPGFLTESFELTEKDWTNMIIPGRPDSDRSILKQIPLKVDMCCFPQNLEYCKKNLPEEICREMEAHLQLVSTGQANCSNPPPEAVCKELEAYLKAKAEYQAAMLKAMQEQQGAQ